MGLQDLGGLQGGPGGAGVANLQTVLNAGRTWTTTLTAGDGPSFSPTLSAVAGIQSALVASPVINQGGTAGYNILDLSWTAPAFGTGDKNGLRINAPAGFVGDGLWFGVNGAEKFAVDQAGIGSFAGAISFSNGTASQGLWIGAYTTYGGLYRTGADDGLKLIVGAGDGTGNRSLVITDSSNIDIIHDHDTQQPSTTVYLHSLTSPAVSNQEWGSAAHDGGDFVLSAGPATGAGSAPTTIRNAVRIDANFVTTEQSGGDNQAATLGAGATTVAITTDFLTLTGDGGGNTVATITGGITGQTLHILCVDALVTITDDATGNADTVNLSAAFTGTADDILTLLHNGTSWREVARSVN